MKDRERYNIQTLSLTPYQREIIRGPVDIVTEIFRNPRSPALNLGGANVRWGKLIPWYVHKARFGDKGVGYQGFDGTWDYPPNITELEAEELEISAASKAIKTACEQVHIPPEEISLIGVGCGSPILRKEPYKNIIARAGGLSDGCLKVQSSVGCASSADVLATMFDVYDAGLVKEGSYVMLVGIDGSKRKILGHNNPLEVGDEYVLSVLSNGAAAFIFRIGKDLIRLQSKNKVLADIKKGIAARTHANYEIDPLGEIIQAVGYDKFLKTPIPDDPTQLMAMIEERIARDVKGMVGTDIAEALQEYRQIVTGEGNPDKQLAFIDSHQPSWGLLQLIAIAAKLSGIPMPWTEHEGNSSAAELVLNLNRLMPWLDPGDDFLTIGYGAGYYEARSLLRVGGKN